jgi:hypothetical protein
MEEKGRHHKSPSLTEASFNCPHCGALTTQFWYSGRAKQLKDNETPIWFTPEEAATFGEEIEDREVRQQMRHWAAEVVSGRPLIAEKWSSDYSFEITNLSISKCYHCKDLGVWVGDKLLWPPMISAASPNVDMPDDIRADFQEAALIVDSSPRGGAALLRLAIQKLVLHLGGAGKNLNDDIADLVKKGLDHRVQQALDVVRVIGNNAVHPGELDIRDDRATAEKLFGLVNLIVDIMISQPKHVQEMFAGLPPGALAAIGKRDKDNS